MILRDGTQDFQAFTEVYGQNEYRLPEAFPADSLVVDVGAHVGAFALACLHRGAGRVVCYEPEAGNYAILELNLLPYQARTASYQTAVWRSDTFCPELRLCHKGAASAMHHVFGDSYGPTVRTSTLDGILGALGDVDLLKLDCEGSEYPILYTAQHLDQVRQLAVECHRLFHFQDCPWDCSPEGIYRLLEAQGFAVELVPHPRSPEQLAYVFASRLPKVPTCRTAC